MKLSGLHLLLTYQCNLECDHCFVWGSPWQSGTMIIGNVNRILQQAKDLSTITWIYFEGGEPFLYFAVLLNGVQQAAQMGFNVGIISNGYWATDETDAFECLKHFNGLIQDLSISNDLYHGKEDISQLIKNVTAAANRLGIPIGIISIAQPESTNAGVTIGQLPPGESGVMYRGRAAEKLVSKTTLKPWEQFVECPFENLQEPSRVHIDPSGNVHICQGISLGNIFHSSLVTICETYDPDSHPVIGPLVRGGPSELVSYYRLPHAESYTDACHLCYKARCTLRGRFPDILIPNNMYGVPD